MSRRHAGGQCYLEKQDICGHPVGLHAAWLGSPQVRSFFFHLSLENAGVSDDIWIFTYYVIKTSLLHPSALHTICTLQMVHCHALIVGNVEVEKSWLLWITDAFSCIQAALCLLTFSYSVQYESAALESTHGYLQHFSHICSWTFQVHVSLYVGSRETGFTGKLLISREVLEEIESYSNKPDWRIQLSDW